MVFVVDDEIVIAETLVTILKRCGFEATSFNDPLKALANAEVGAPDMLISDVVMPQISGVELAIRLKALCPSCKILLFSGQAQTANLLEKARELGHDFNLLTKPVHPRELLRQIREQHDGWMPGEMTGT
ncbi:CheY-like chemotaxis protein [Granulicella aggregans]|uniref:CheY-like chemotaxis protein n=1 Tax=Granulicella aggregans TaxID=474949 RepID=A0A7W7ZIB6_9BACT|nr:response regulator [Granulicella aggregans]MBB5060460.1 CheY-like chemotaxis protein [Granulicella aggregans]